MNIGVDLVSVVRFRKIRQADYTRWTHVFSEKEWAYAFGDARSAEHLAGIFAAKEAAMKAYGKASVKKFRLFEVRHDSSSGAPALTRRGASLSISHDKNMAIAVVLVV